MMNDERMWVSAIGAFAVTASAILALRPVAYAVDLVDRPGGHKTHHGTVPVVGGLGMVLGLTFGLASQAGSLGDLQQFLFSAVLLVVVGMLDDRFNLMPGLRLAAQFTAVLPMFFGAGVRLESFGDLLGVGALTFPGWSFAATAIVAMAAINAFNMLDGLDGLAGGIGLVAIALLIGATSTASHPEAAFLGAVLAGCIVGFLLFNAPVPWNRGVRCFMGDAGSTLLGFSLAWLTISLSQGPARSAAPVTMVWLVAVPATDLVSTVVRRALRGHSPLHPDNEHLHHLLLQAGLGVRAVFAILVVISGLLGWAGLELERHGVPEFVSFMFLIGAGIVLVIACRSPRLVRAVVPTALHRRDSKPIA
jgi:UDP-GlcNAc:undecaprenyl-phosphate GlcNAc-1-phosphate transferase